jgi:hypothetical protein
MMTKGKKSRILPVHLTQTLEVRERTTQPEFACRSKCVRWTDPRAMSFVLVSADHRSSTIPTGFRT